MPAVERTVLLSELTDAQAQVGRQGDPVDVHLLDKDLDLRPVSVSLRFALVALQLSLERLLVPDDERLETGVGVQRGL